MDRGAVGEPGVPQESSLTSCRSASSPASTATETLALGRPDRVAADGFNHVQRRVESGTRCSMPVFIRGSGMRHSRASRSISAHVASRASPESTGGEHGEPKARPRGHRRPRRFDDLQRGANVAVRQRPEVRLDRRQGRQRAVDGVASEVVLHVAVRLRPGQRRADALSNLAADFGAWRSRWASGRAARLRGRSGRRADRRRRGARTCPSWRSSCPSSWRCASAAGSLPGRARSPPGRSGSRPPLVGERVNPVRDGDTVGERALSSLGERHNRPPAQAEIATPPPMVTRCTQLFDPPAPRRGTGPAVTVPAGMRERAHRHDSESPHAFDSVFPHKG